MSSTELTLKQRALLAFAGVLIAAFAAMCGIGGGLFAISILHYGFRFPLKRAVATGLGLVAVTTFSATVAESLHAESAIDWRVVGTMLVGGLIGTQIGFRVAKWINPKRLKQVFTVVLAIAAVRIFLGRPDALVMSGEAIEFSALELIGVALIGMVAGFTSPLLGIGGGMVSVPSLFLGFPDFGYLGARACSMALGAMTSARAVWLYQREGLVDFRVASWLGGGALLGAFLGVQLVHLNGADRVGQILLALLLISIAARFAWDTRPGAQPESLEV